MSSLQQNASYFQQADGLNSSVHNVSEHSTTHHRPAQDHGLLLFYLIMLSVFGTQSALVYWKQRFQRSYELVTLAGLWLVPAIISVKMVFWRFLLVWLLYTAGVGFILLIAVGNKRMAPSTPRQAYMFFLGIHQTCVIGGVLGYGILVVSFVAAPTYIGASVLGPFGLMLTWYCLYFGVLNRDCAEVAANRIALVMGAGRRLAVSVRKCGVCDGDLTDFDTHTAEDVARGNTRRHGGLFGRSTVQLPCKHLFHDSCIRGWTLVGKRSTCPSCHEKVDLRLIYADRPWETRNLSWIKMLDALRYMVCWMPIIFTTLHFVFKSLGLEESGLPVEDAEALAANATGPVSGFGSRNLTAATDFLQLDTGQNLTLS